MPPLTFSALADRTCDEIMRDLKVLSLFSGDDMREQVEAVLRAALGVMDFSVHPTTGEIVDPRPLTSSVPPQIGGTGLPRGGRVRRRR